MRAGKRALYFVHRWLGIITCVFCLIWFVSGLVMVYVPFPAWTDAERLGSLRAVDGAQISYTPDQALAAAGMKAGPAVSVRLESYGNEPVYRISSRDKIRTISGVDGRPIGPISAEEAKSRLAVTFEGTRIAYLETVDRDQWTVVSRFDSYRPLYLFALRDDAATRVYVSSQTGEIVQNSTANERFWNWLGAIPHWIYLTPIRQEREIWRQVIMWSSGPLILTALAGLWIGILRLRVRKPYSGGRVTPYRGWMKWHHVGGLVGGVFLTTWIFSGWLSVNPFGVFPRTQLTAAQKQAYSGIQPAFGITLEALKAATQKPWTALQFDMLSGEPLIAAKGADGRKGLFDGWSGAPRELPESDLADAAQRLYPNVRLIRSERLTHEDLYWYSHHVIQPLPAMRYIFDDANATWVHVDPVTSELLGVSDRSSRVYRWLFGFLHDFDLPVLLRNQPARDILIWILSLAGLVISFSGIVVGWRYLKRRSKRTAVPKRIKADANCSTSSVH